jgi:hypothetical protein
VGCVGSEMNDFLVLQDGPVELDKRPGGPGDVKVLTFTLPANFTVGVNFGKPLLAYIINPRSDDATVGIWVNPGRTSSSLSLLKIMS